MRKRILAKDNVAFITGASSGIGESLARAFAKRGLRVALAARRQDRLRALAQELGDSSRAIALECDVTVDGSVEKAVELTRAAWRRVDVCVANAGFGVVGRFAQLTLADFRRQFETNFFGVLRTIYAALPSLRESQGQLALMSSVGGYVGTPLMSAYAASKFALRGLADSVRSELSHERIGVTLISPGFVKSEIGRVNNRGEVEEQDRNPVPDWLRMSSTRAAEHMVRAIGRREADVIVTLHGKAMVTLERLAPGALRAGMRRLPLDMVKV
jgi:short-subunit dehydrogenase